MAELVERDWAMEEIKFWENRAKHYRDMVFDLMAKMLEGVKFDSVEWTADGITWKEKQSGWISCEERLPEEDTDVLISYRYKEGEGDTSHVYIDITSYGDMYFGGRKVEGVKHWRPPFEYFTSNYEVIAWMPLPEPYREME